MDIYAIDFETFYDKDFTFDRLSTSEYVLDERFEVIGVGVRFPVGSIRWFEAFEYARWVQTIDWSVSAALHHHAQFDGLVNSHHFNVRPAFVFDSLSMARVLHGTHVGKSLLNLMLKYGLGSKGEAVHWAKGKRRKDFTQQEWIEYGDYCKTDVGGTWELFLKMLERAGTTQGPFPESELKLVDLTIKMFTEPAFVLDEPLMRQFLVDEGKRKAELIARATKASEEVAGSSTTKDKLMSNDQFAALLMELGVEPPQKWSAKKKRMDWAFAKSDPGFQDLLHHEDDDVRMVVEARLGVKSTIDESRTARFLRLGAGGRRMPVYLNFAGAHTFRWSGGDKMNWQNLKRADDKDTEEVLAAGGQLVGTIRRAIMAPPRHKVVAGDSGQIEARKIAWLAGQDDLVDAFRQADANGPDAEEDVYTHFASELYHRRITRKDKLERSVGKFGALALGYGMGFAKAAMSFAAGPMGAKPVIFTEADAEVMGVDVLAFAERPFGWVDENSDEDAEPRTCLDVVLAAPSRLAPEPRVVHFAVADHIVRTYRAKYPRITAFWKTCNRLIEAMYVGEEMALTNEDGVDIVQVVFDGEGDDVVAGLRLPSGLVMRYPGLRQSKSGYAYRGGERRGRGADAYVEMSKIYGGLVAENIDQALSRIVVSDQALMAHEAGYKVATLTHDEIVLVVEDARVDQAVEDLGRFMRTPPTWCRDLPLSATVGAAQRYGDAH